MGTGSFESAAEVVACEKSVSVEIDRQTIEGQVGSVMDLVRGNRAREKGRKQPEINKASHGEAVTLQGAFDEQGSRIGVQRGHNGIVPTGDAEAVTHFDF